MEGGTLHDEIHGRGPLPLDRVVDALLDATRGIMYLHSKNVIHRDLKPRNLLVSRGMVKVADMGESKQLAHATLARTAGSFGEGTLAYMAPEMRIVDDFRTVKIDLFNLGVIIIEMDSGRQPNPGPEMRRLGPGQFVGVPEAERRATELAAMRHPRLRDLALACIDDAEERRPTAARVLELLEGVAASDEYRQAQFAAAPPAAPAGGGEAAGGAAVAAADERFAEQLRAERVARAAADAARREAEEHLRQHVAEADAALLAARHH